MVHGLCGRYLGVLVVLVCVEAIMLVAVLCVAGQAVLYLGYGLAAAADQMAQRTPTT